MKLTPKQRSRIKSEMSTEKPTLWVGKKGITPQLVEEALKHLDRRQVLKVRFLKSALAEADRETLARELERATESTLVEIRGHTAVFYKPKRRKKLKTVSSFQ